MTECFWSDLIILQNDGFLWRFVDVFDVEILRQGPRLKEHP